MKKIFSSLSIVSVLYGTVLYVTFINTSAALTSEYLTKENYAPKDIVYTFMFCRSGVFTADNGGWSSVGFSVKGDEQEAKTQAKDYIVDRIKKFKIADCTLEQPADMWFSLSRNSPSSKWICRVGDFLKPNFYPARSAYGGGDNWPMLHAIGDTQAEARAILDKNHRLLGGYSTPAYKCDTAGGPPCITNERGFLINGYPLSVDAGVQCDNIDNVVQHNRDTKLTSPKIQIINDGSDGKVIEVSDIERSGSSVRYTCEQYNFNSPNEKLVDEKTLCSTTTGPNENNLYFKVPVNIYDISIVVKAERVKTFANNIAFSNLLPLKKFEWNAPQISINRDSSKAINGTITNIDPNTSYSCVFAPAEDNTPRAYAFLPLPAMKDFVQDASECRIIRNFDNTMSFSVPYGLSAKYLAIKAALNNDPENVKYSRVMTLYSLLETPKMTIAFSSNDGKSKTVRVTYDSPIPPAVKYEYDCVYAMDNTSKPAFYPYGTNIGNRADGLCTISSDGEITTNSELFFNVSSRLNGYYVAVKVKATAADGSSVVRFSNPILLKDEIANNCTYTNTNDPSFGLVCSPLPACGAPTKDDVKVSFNNKVFEVQSHSTRTSNTQIMVRNYDGKGEIGHVVSSGASMTETPNPNDPTKYYDYQLYNICEHDKPDSWKNRPYCKVRVFRDGVTDPKVCF